ncbi:MAG: homoserine O-acetyltransferase [Armatimonadetes bacterium]|nr:homoserine O-acetyltransferase [Armatimonadota bacterium]
MGDLTGVLYTGLVTKQAYAFGSDDAPFVLENKQTLPRIEIAYETYGVLNAARDNCVLVTHGITGSSHAAGKYAESNRTVGFWDNFIGAGKVFDTDRFFVVCMNSLGGCRGTTGPASMNPVTGKPYGLSFPIVTIRDMVRVQERVLRELWGVTNLALVAGGSMGGMQALEWGVLYPDRVGAIVPIATSGRVSARAIAFNEIARRAILLDPHFQKGNYYDKENKPDGGLALARMVGTVTYLNDHILEEMFGRKSAVEESALEHDLHARFDVERYLHDEGAALVKRFDANSYLYMTKAVDLHDISRGFTDMASAVRRITAPTLLVSISSDDLFPPEQMERVRDLLMGAGGDVRYFCMESAYGHDAFLVESGKMEATLRNFVTDRVGG